MVTRISLIFMKNILSATYGLRNKRYLINCVISSSSQQMANIMKKTLDTSGAHRFQTVMKYPVMFLSLGGIFSGVKDLALHTKQEKGIKCEISMAARSTFRVFCRHIYRIITGLVNCGCLAKAIVMIIVYGTFDKTTVEEALAIPFCAFVWLSATYVYYKFFPALSAKFQAYETKFGYTHDISRTERRAKITSVVVLSLHSCFKLAFGLVHILCLNDSVSYIYPFVSEGRTRQVACVTVTLVYFLIEVTPYYLLVHYVFIMYILTAEFRGVRDEMSEIFIIATNFEERFDLVRGKHRCLQDIVHLSSLHFRSAVVLTFIFNILVFCFLIYLVSNGKYTMYGLAVQIIAAGVSICGTLCITVVGGALNTAAHSVCDSINNGDWNNLSVPALQKINIFMTQFAIKKIGIDIYGLFVLDTTTLLMITGTVVTYGVVYLQFNITPEPTCQTVIDQTANGTIVAQST